MVTFKTQSTKRKGIGKKYLLEGKMSETFLIDRKHTFTDLRSSANPKQGKHTENHTEVLYDYLAEKQRENISKQVKRG